MRIGGLAAEGAHWGYEGEAGPAHWGDMDAANKVCAIGSQQSPIDIAGTDQGASFRTEDRLGQKSRYHRQQRPHHPAQHRARQHAQHRASDDFTLLQFHFHHPSEHQISGKDFPMEAHFVHRNATGSLAVVGVLMTAGKPTGVQARSPPPCRTHKAEPVKADTAHQSERLLPAQDTYYRYEGSLTTPPCSEVVEWLLLRDPIHVAEDDIDALRQALSDERAPGAEDGPAVRAKFLRPSIPPLKGEGLSVTHFWPRFPPAPSVV